MTQSIDIPSKDSPFWIESALEIKFLFKNLMKRAEKVTLWLSESEFIVSIILDVLESGEIIFDLGGDRKVNAKMQNSSFIVFTASIDKVDIKCVIEGVREGKFQGGMAFFAKFPKRVHKLQRREFYRVATPVAKPIFCQLNIEIKSEKEPNVKMVKQIPAQVIDISLGGVCIIEPSVAGVGFKSGEIIDNCSILLPEFGQIQFNLMFCHIFETESRTGVVKRRVGCKFLNISQQDQMTVQKYMTKLERDRKAVAA